MNGVMDNAALLEIIKKLLKTDTDLSFLLTLPVFKVGKELKGMVDV